MILFVHFIHSFIELVGQPVFVHVIVIKHQLPLGSDDTIKKETDAGCILVKLQSIGEEKFKTNDFK